MSTYTDRLNQDPQWVMEQGARYFQGKSEVDSALQRIIEHLDKLGVPYALSGGMALLRHGYRRFTEDVDLLIRPADVQVIHEALEGRGYLPVFRGSKNLRDTEAGVAIEFLLSGEYPGDGRPKPVSFPDPAAVGVDIRGVKCLNLHTLIELKLASGMSGAGRLKDLADVQELIKALNLDRAFAEQLNPYVRDKFFELMP